MMGAAQGGGGENVVASARDLPGSIGGGPSRLHLSPGPRRT